VAATTSQAAREAAARRCSGLTNKSRLRPITSARPHPRPLYRAWDRVRSAITTIHHEATAWYSRMSPPMRSRRPISGTSLTGAIGERFSGTASSSPR